ncbi:hypothetical protein LL254_00505 [Marinobacter nauticus]|uniref:hypothetical protein n=1 Tax=Marinobacter nauticus TaxID=2743 RepID=UPI001D186496|nr:hypothetical protein [Marinobacter nauticus]MCC4269187.1 hypothetical protein [Marinobacter nauticus]
MIETKPSEKACKFEGCEKPPYLKHKLCERHHHEKLITDRWDRWIEVNKGFQALDHLAVHPRDWEKLGRPDQHKGISLKPLGIDCCMCVVCVIFRRQRGAERAAK